jgi:putative transposase
MAQSLSMVIVHFVFSTKDRFPFLSDREFRLRMHAYLAEVFRSFSCRDVDVGGTEDHVHILCSLCRTHSIAEVIGKTKAGSSAWAKQQRGIMQKFEWQGGYGAFSIHPSQMQETRSYVNDQEEHHRTRSFQEEFLDFLHKYKMPYDERYILK